MNCPCCSHFISKKVMDIGDRLFKITSEPFQLRKCMNCKVIFLFPQPDIKKMSTYYPDVYWFTSDLKAYNLRNNCAELYRRTALFNQIHFVKQIVRIKNGHSGNIKILDIGCGDGSFLESIGISPCIGLDISKKAVRASKRRGIETICASLADTPFKEKSFSIITMFHFMEHVSPPDEYFNAVKKLLIDDGDLVIQIPNTDSFQAKILRKRWIGYDVPRHIINYSIDSIRYILETNGFKIIRLSHFSLRDNSASLSMSLFPELYPPVRSFIYPANSKIKSFILDLLFLLSNLYFLPFALIESFLSHGGSIMIHAKRN